jgi:trans-aconitate methyltransferase
LIRCLYKLVQTGTVADYVQQFAELMDQLSAYEEHPDMLHYVTRFVDGLQPQVCLLVAVQLPQDLETSYTIACVQEEVSTRDLVHVVPSPANTRRNAVVMHSVPQAVDDKKVHETVKSFNHKRLLEDKLLALKDYRKAKGLCFTCGECWSCNHKCQATV